MTRAIGNLGLGFLHAIFAEEREAGIGGFANDRSREVYAHRDQLYVFRRASGTGAGGGNAFLHCGQVIGNLRHAGMLV